MTENIFTEPGLETLLREVRKSVEAKKIEFTDDGLMVINTGIRIATGGVFDIDIRRDELVQRAIDDQDPEKEAWARTQVLLGKGKGYFDYDKSHTHNLMPDAALNFNLGLLVGAPTKKATWYPSAFRTDSTPDSTWDANWGGAGSGPKAGEVNASYVTASARAAATFGTASSKSIAMSSAVEYTVKAAVSGLAVYGGTLNSSSAFDYNTAYDGTNGHVLLAATRRASAATGLATGDKISILYTLSGTSS